MSRVLACITLAVAAGPAAACLNDVELAPHEREFRSQYRDPSVAPPALPSEPTERPSTSLLVGTGTTLLVGAAALALSGRRAGN